ncbi:MAG: cytochrome P450 [Alphaproteobacteria bacterium]|nr:cytochrome P450 [Alphaproteobacteria bacterium]
MADHPRHRLGSPLRFALDTAAFKRDPHPTFARMRDAGPMIPLKLPFIGRAWATTTYASTLALVKDNDLFVQESRHAGKSGVVGFTWWMPRSLKTLTNNMLLKDEPDHRRLRKLVDQAFMRRGVQEMRPRIDAMADALLDELESLDSVDLLNDFARRLPLDVICEVLGLPNQDRAVFAEWTKLITQINKPHDIIRALGAINRMIDYVRGQIEDCRRSPRPGLLGELVRAEADGDTLDEDERLSMVFLLLAAGFETTTHLIGGAVIALDQNPAQKAYLLADPAARMERAVEEIGRFWTPVQTTKPRYVAHDADFFGQPLRRGDVVVALLAAANADPAHFDAPETLRLDRFPNQHLVFSSGIHFCLGMQLARVETQSALSRLYARFPDLAIPPADQLDWITRFGIRGVKSLPAQLAPHLRRAA